jgi:glycosyltransferase involved in cell wall biosynthesis
MRAVRILHLVTRSQRRGAELVAVELARGLDSLGHTNQVLALGLGFDGGEDVDLPPLTRRSDGGFYALWLGARALRKHLALEPVDVLIAHGGRAVEAAVIARRRGRPLIVWQRILGFPPHMWRPVRRMRWRAIVHRIDAAVALTPDLGDELGRLGFKGPIWAIANFRDPEPFVAVDRDAAANDLRAELGIPRDVGLIGFVGHLIAQKRPDRALDVLTAMHHLGEQAHLVVAGDGPLRNRFELDVAERGLADFVHVLGHRNDIPQILAAIDVFILTSDSEGLPGVLIEAQMAGCPVVTVPVGGVRDLVDDGETGIVTDDLDPEELARRVVELLRDRQLRVRLGERARRRAVRFSSTRAAGTYAARLAEVVGTSRFAERDRPNRDRLDRNQM